MAVKPPDADAPQDAHPLLSRRQSARFSTIFF
jgi:hypothetical protein